MMPASYAPRDPPPDSTMPIFGRVTGACTALIVAQPRNRSRIRLSNQHGQAPGFTGRGAGLTGARGGDGLRAEHRAAWRGCRRLADRARDAVLDERRRGHA